MDWMNDEPQGGMKETMNEGRSRLFMEVTSKPQLLRAWRKVRANRGAAGIDAITIRRFERNLDLNLGELSRNLRSRSYEPAPSRYVEIPKSDGRRRELGIPTVRDRVAQRAVLDAIEPEFERQFLDCSFAFRAGRSPEMAVQRMVVARANGYRWTVEGDILEFFPSIDHRLLMEEVERTVSDRDILRLIEVWLDSGVLDGSRDTSGGLRKVTEGLANVGLTARDALDGMIQEYLSQRLSTDYEYDGRDDADPMYEREMGDEGEAPARKSGIGRAAVKHLMQEGVVLALAHRRLLKGLISARGLAVGGMGLGLALAAPPMIRKLRELTDREVGALQGAPISPLLSNIHLQPFDLEVTGRGYKLIRYCDDFVVLCRTQQEAQSALAAIESSLKSRRLRVNPTKTDILPPEVGFNFLGYEFSPDGTVTAPPNIPEVVRRRVAEFASREWKATRQRTVETSRKVQPLLGRTAAQVRDKLKRG